MLNQIRDMKAVPGFETVFDPQLYYPRSERGHLPTWSYYPSYVDTTDIQSEAWWDAVADRVAEACNRLVPSAACSPAFAPQVYDNEYYSRMVSVGNRFAEGLKGASRPIQTVLVSMADLSDPRRPLEIASIVSRTKGHSVYLIFVNDVEPRRELKDTAQLVGGMHIISALQKAGISVIVGYTSADFVLWKSAGAAHCCTGKFFNLRRFTKARFGEPSEGGGQLPYWFEEGLLAFLRESDVIRISKTGMLSAASRANPFFTETLTLIEKGDKWLAKSWRYYMYGFCSLESRIGSGHVDVTNLLLEAERNWLSLEDRKVLMEEARNNGDWIRAWRRALVEA